MSSTRGKSARAHAGPDAPGTGQNRAPTTTDGNSRRALLVAAIVAVLVVVTAVYFLGTADDSGAPRSAATKVAHVHGLGVDPADGALYAGTHYGLFRIPESGGASRVGDRVQDFMGFTVAGANHYLASGHPGEGQGGPSAVGLIESTDGGKSWRSMSLSGEADFHSIEARHGQVYGLNSVTGQLMVSTDKKTWEERSSVPMADFAVDPQDPDIILATTQQGVARSTDGGRSFERLPDAPLLMLVSWADDGTIVGVDPSGVVNISRDAAQVWQQRGEVGGSPDALVATSGDEVYAAVEGSIVASDDGGKTFNTLYED